MLPNPVDDLVDYFASLLKTPRGRVSTTANVLELGADSIMLMEARTWIEGRYGRRIEIRRFFEDLNTIDALAAFLADAPPAGTVSGAPAAVPPPASSPVGLATADIRLMRSQLALVAEVIEAQNRVAGAARRATPPTAAAAADINHQHDAAEASVRKTKVTAA